MFIIILNLSFPSHRGLPLSHEVRAQMMKKHIIKDALRHQPIDRGLKGMAPMTVRDPLITQVPYDSLGAI